MRARLQQLSLTVLICVLPLEAHFSCREGCSVMDIIFQISMYTFARQSVWSIPEAGSFDRSGSLEH